MTQAAFPLPHDGIENPYKRLCNTPTSRERLLNDAPSACTRRTLFKAINGIISTPERADERA
ncbi:hypothetical protein FRC05_000716, partial [Tulasnella sp. 425]